MSIGFVAIYLLSKLFSINLCVFRCYNLIKSKQFWLLIIFLSITRCRVRLRLLGIEKIQRNFASFKINTFSISKNHFIIILL